VDRESEEPAHADERARAASQTIGEKRNSLTLAPLAQTRSIDDVLRFKQTLDASGDEKASYYAEDCYVKMVSHVHTEADLHKAYQVLSGRGYWAPGTKSVEDFIKKAGEIPGGMMLKTMALDKQQAHEEKRQRDFAESMRRADEAREDEERDRKSKAGSMSGLVWGGGGSGSNPFR